MINSSLLHYLECKTKQPLDTSACIVVPYQPDAPWYGKLSTMRKVWSYEVNSCVFKDPATHAPLPGVPWVMEMYHDEPLKRIPKPVPKPPVAQPVPDDARMSVMRLCAAVGEVPLTLKFMGKLAGVASSVLMDTGASHCYLSQDFVTSASITTVPITCVGVSLANGSVSMITSYCDLQLTIDRYCSFVCAFMSRLWRLLTLCLVITG